jgi:hypothetical protein
MTIVICDSSLLILISKLELLDLMLEAFGDVLIPQAVYIEAVEQGKKLKKIDSFLIEKNVNDGKISIEKVKNLNEKEKLINNFNLHEGESEAIILYLEKKADLLGTDDYRTLKACKILKIKYFTTPLFISRCYSNKKLPKQIILLKLDKLLELGWYKEELIREFKNKIKNQGVS